MQGGDPVGKPTPRTPLRPVFDHIEVVQFLDCPQSTIRVA
jgi:hypothetical protein